MFCINLLISEGDCGGGDDEVIRGGLMRENCCSFGFCPNEGGGGRALPKFFVTFS